MKNIFIFLSFLSFSFTNGNAQTIKSTLKLSLDCMWEKDPPIYTDKYIAANGLGMYKSVGYELNFLKTSFIGVSSGVDAPGFELGSDNRFDSAYNNKLKGMYRGRGEFKYWNFYLGSRIPTFKWCNQSFNFSVGISRARGTMDFVDRYGVDTTYFNTAYVTVYDYEYKKVNAFSPLIQAGYDFNLFKSWLNIGVDFRIRNYADIGWQYNYGVTFGHNFKKILPHKEDFKSFADFVTVDKKEKESWSNVKENKNTVTLEYSAPDFGYWRGTLFFMCLPGVNYERKINRHFIAGANINLWYIPNSIFNDNELYNLNFNDTTNVNMSKNYKSANLYWGYALNLGTVGKQTISLSAGISATKGVNGRSKKTEGNYSYQIIETKEAFLGPLLQFEYNINPLRNHLNLGVHARAKYYPFFKYELDFGVHAGVNF